MAANPFVEIGSAGYRTDWSGNIMRTALRELNGKDGRERLYEMRDTDPVAGAVVTAIELLCRGVGWSVEPADESAAAQEEAEFVEGVFLKDMSHSFDDLITDAMSMIVYGWCMPPDQEILDHSGRPFPIGQAEVGQSVLTKLGRGRRITNIFRRSYDGDLVVIRAQGYPNLIRLTPEHQVMTVTGWKAAGDLTEADVLLRPRPQLNPGGDHLAGWLVGLYLAEGTRDSDRTRVSYHLAAREVDEVAAAIQQWVDDAKLEKHWHRAILGPRVAALTPTAGRVTISHPAFRDLIDCWVEGGNAHTKRLRAFPTEEEFARGLVEGWLYGDGTDFVDRRGFPQRAGATVSRALAQQMQLLAGALGLPGAMSCTPGGGRCTAPGAKPDTVLPACYRVSLLEQAKLRLKRTVEAEAEVRALHASGVSMNEIHRRTSLSYVTVMRWLKSDGPKAQGQQPTVYQQAVGHRILSVERQKYEGEVLDLEVDEDHSFCAGPFAVSNCFVETVYKRRVGPDQADPALRSDFDDGRIGIRKMVGRSQLTLKKWELDETGGVQAFVQEVEGKPNGVRIPIERGLLFRTAREMGSPEGRSALRSAYLAFRARRHVEQIELVGIERELAGVPYAKVPSKVLTPSADPVEESARVAAHSRWVESVRDLKNNEQGSLIIPSDPYVDSDGKPTSIPMYEYGLLTTGGTRAIDTNGTIQRLAYDVFRSAMADMMMLGATSAGSFALSKDKSSFFTACITWYVDVIQDTINRHQISRLWELNGLDHRLKPTFKHGEVASVDLEAVGGFVQKIAGAGIPIGGHEPTENALRRMVGLPEVDEEVFAEREAQEQEDREMQMEAQQAEVDALRARQGQKPPPA